MMSVGWAIWRLAGLHSYQARDFLIDGYGIWSADPNTDYFDKRDFLRDLYDTLEVGPAPDCPPDIYSVPPEQVAPAADYYGTIAWAGAEMFAQAEAAADEETVGMYRDRIYQAFIGMNIGFLPARSMAIARAIAASAGLPDPFLRPP